MNAARNALLEKKGSFRSLEATNFFLADVQTGLGPFLAASLAGAGWQPGKVGIALTVGASLRCFYRLLPVRLWTVFIRKE